MFQKHNPEIGARPETPAIPQYDEHAVERFEIEDIALAADPILPRVAARAAPKRPKKVQDRLIHFFGALLLHPMARSRNDELPAKIRVVRVHRIHQVHADGVSKDRVVFASKKEGGLPDLHLVENGELVPVAIHVPVPIDPTPKARLPVSLRVHVQVLVREPLRKGIGHHHALEVA